MLSFANCLLRLFSRVDVVLVTLLVWWLRCHSANGEDFEPELIRSFLSRPWMLTNATIQDPKVDPRKGQVVTSLYVDNWSPYYMKLNRNKIRILGEVSPTLAPRDLPAKARVLAVRVVAGNSPSTAGIVCWDLTIKKIKMKASGLCVAWDVGNGKTAEMAVSIGTHMPTFQKIWFVPDGHRKRELSTEKTNQLDNTIYVGHRQVAVVAANLSMPEGETMHYRLTMSVLPTSIDVWGWVKYYRNSSVVPRPPKSSANDAPSPKDVRRGFVTKATTEKTNGATALAKNEEIPLLDQKHLLGTGPTLLRLFSMNRTLMDALKDAKAQTAVGMHVENWLNSPLNLWKSEIGSGQVLVGRHAEKSAPGPGNVAPGSQDVGIVVQKSVLSGTSGVIRWTIGNSDRILSVMWSLPYSRQFWRTWIAVGLTSGGSELPTYREMYRKTDDSRFVRRQAGRQFEFSDGTYIVIARMDGRSTSKIKLHLAIAPIDSNALAENVRNSVGVKSKHRSAIVKSRSPRKQNNSITGPIYDHVQGKAAVSPFHKTWDVVGIALLSPLYLYVKTQ